MSYASEQAERSWCDEDDRWDRPSRRRQVAGIDYPAIPTSKRCRCGAEVWWLGDIATQGDRYGIGRTYGWRMYERHGTPIYTNVLHICAHEPGRFYCDRKSAAMGRDWGTGDFWRGPTDRCHCRPGRDHDGSEWGYCTYCEAVDEGHDDETIENMINDFDPRKDHP